MAADGLAILDGSAKSKYNLIRLSSDHRIEYGALVIVTAIAQHSALRLQNEAGRLDLPLHAHRVNAMQGFGIPQPRPGLMKSILEASFRCECRRLEDCERLVTAKKSCSTDYVQTRVNTSENLLQRLRKKR